MTDIREGDVLWSPTPDGTEPAILRFGQGRPYEQLYQDSIADLGAFWSRVWDFCGVVGQKGDPPYLVGELPDSEFFPQGTLNYAECAFARFKDPAQIVCASETGSLRRVPASQFWADVAGLAEGMRGFGVEVGDAVCGYLPNVYEAVVCLYAAASVGAIWSCCSPDFGVGAVVDRFSQIQPRLLFAVSSYRYNGTDIDRTQEVTEIVSRLGSLARVVHVGQGPGIPAFSDSWDEVCQSGAKAKFERVAFSHPLWVLYSSGTTGIPKAIVHGHGGIVLEHKKTLELMSGVAEGSVFFWYTSTGWMMWNLLVGGLQVGASIVLYDGSPAAPDLGRLWRLIDETGITYFGVSAPYLRACESAGVSPSREARLASLKVIGSTGAPLTVDGFAWVANSVPKGVQIVSTSGGTDVCTAFLGSSPMHPTWAGRISTRALGVKAYAADSEGRELIGTMGELVIAGPMPSMPLGLWGDSPERTRYKAAYFEPYGTLWRHGDWVTFFPDGSAVIFGRSDATLNRGGVRMGTAEFYRVVESLAQVTEALVVDTSALGSEGKLILFVVTEGDWDEVQEQIRERLRRDVSPRHVPDVMLRVDRLPHTLNGKKLEVPVRRLLLGEPLESVASLDAVADAQALIELRDVISANLLGK